MNLEEKNSREIEEFLKSEGAEVVGFASLEGIKNVPKEYPNSILIGIPIEKEIGKGFKFKVKFQKWLKANPNKTYQDAINAYHELQNSNEKTVIDKQFQYNQYIRDFFKDNDDKTLNDAIKCWNYKKSIKGHNKYEKSDLCILTDMEN